MNRTKYSGKEFIDMEKSMLTETELIPIPDTKIQQQQHFSQFQSSIGFSQKVPLMNAYKLINQQFDRDLNLYKKAYIMKPATQPQEQTKKMVAEYERVVAANLEQTRKKQDVVVGQSKPHQTPKSEKPKSKNPFSKRTEPKDVSADEIFQNSSNQFLPVEQAGTNNNKSLKGYQDFEESNNEFLVITKDDVFKPAKWSKSKNSTKNAYATTFQRTNNSNPSGYAQNATKPEPSKVKLPVIDQKSSTRFQVDPQATVSNQNQDSSNQTLPSKWRNSKQSLEATGKVKTTVEELPQLSSATGKWNKPVFGASNNEANNKCQLQTSIAQGISGKAVSKWEKPARKSVRQQTANVKNESLVNVSMGSETCSQVISNSQVIMDNDEEENINRENKAEEADNLVEVGQEVQAEQPLSALKSKEPEEQLQEECEGEEQQQQEEEDEEEDEEEQQQQQEEEESSESEEQEQEDEQQQEEEQQQQQQQEDEEEEDGEEQEEGQVEQEYPDGESQVLQSSKKPQQASIVEDGQRSYHFENYMPSEKEEQEWTKAQSVLKGLSNLLK